MFKTRTNILAAVLIGNLLATVASATRPSFNVIPGPRPKPNVRTPPQRVVPIDRADVRYLDARIVSITAQLNHIDESILNCSRKLGLVVKSKYVKSEGYAVYLDKLIWLGNLRRQVTVLLRDLKDRRSKMGGGAASSRPGTRRGGMRCIIVQEKKAGGRPSTPGAK
ncbi:MAG: hypothetical protein QGG42_12130 [Phycisphaerae bacterium]|jgi:hypothetical protein|nr:hypothetical protein [Phycisphaerae bacterium]